jgi:hypothetical protein
LCREFLHLGFHFGDLRAQLGDLRLELRLIRPRGRRGEGYTNGERKRQPARTAVRRSSWR